MSQDPQQNLFLLVDPAAGPQGRAQQPLVPREPALDLPPLAVDPAVTGDPRGLLRNRLTICRRYLVFGHFRPVLRRFSGMTVERMPSRSPARAWLCSASKAPSPSSVSTGQRPAAARDRRLELRRVLARAAADVGREEQVAAGLQDGGQLRPARRVAPAARTARRSSG